LDAKEDKQTPKQRCDAKKRREGLRPAQYWLTESERQEMDMLFNELKGERK